MSCATKRGPCGGRSATAQPPGAQLRALAPVKVQPAATQERARRTSFTDGIAGRAAAASVANSAAVQMAERRGMVRDSSAMFVSSIVVRPGTFTKNAQNLSKPKHFLVLWFFSFTHLVSSASSASAPDSPSSPLRPSLTPLSWPPHLLEVRLPGACASRRRATGSVPRALDAHPPPPGAPVEVI